MKTTARLSIGLRPCGRWKDRRRHQVQGCGSCGYLVWSKQWLNDGGMHPVHSFSHKMNNHCRCFHCIPLYSISLATIAAHEVARQPFIYYWSHVSTVTTHLSCPSRPLSSLKPRPNRVTEKVVFSSWMEERSVTRGCFSWEEWKHMVYTAVPWQPYTSGLHSQWCTVTMVVGNSHTDRNVYSTCTQSTLKVRTYIRTQILWKCISTFLPHTHTHTQHKLDTSCIPDSSWVSTLLSHQRYIRTLTYVQHPKPPTHSHLQEGGVRTHSAREVKTTTARQQQHCYYPPTVPVNVTLTHAISLVALSLYPTSLRTVIPEPVSPH